MRGLISGLELASFFVGDRPLSSTLTRAIFLGAAIANALLPAVAVGQMLIVDKDAEPGAEAPGFVLPYAFHSDVLDLAFGAVAGKRGLLQPQDGAFLNLVGSTNGSWVGHLYGDGFKTPLSKRLFLSPRISVGDYAEIDTFANGNPDFLFDGDRAGTNDSAEDNFIRSEGTDQWYRMVLKYVLPIGHGRDTIVPTYVLDGGLLHEGSTGGDIWNPLRSGRTIFELEPFYRSQDFDADFGSDELETGGAILTLRHENVDFLPNPSQGSIQRISFTRDWGVQDSESSYTMIDLELVKYFSLGESERFRQRVLALNFWTADTPSWDVDVENGVEVITHRPPNYSGATLGGLDRLRGFPTARFNDKAAIYYAAELRLIPRWNPLGEVQWLKRFARVDWWQFVPFVELGRVAPHWNLSELHTDMKWSAGLGIRAMVNSLLIRAEAGLSTEGMEIQMMITHPFPQL